MAQVRLSTPLKFSWRRIKIVEKVEKKKEADAFKYQIKDYYLPWIRPTSNIDRSKLLASFYCYNN